MADRPILFQGPMIRALLAGTKTQTRRVVKWRGLDKGLNLSFSGLRAVQDRAGLWALESDTRTSIEHRCDVTPCPYGAPGDRLWVREAWAHDASSLEECRAKHEDIMGGGGGYGPYYRATEIAPDTLRWRPSIHMPRWASRITLEVTEVRVEKLQDISEADAIAEGIPTSEVSPPDMARFAYRQLWDSINGAGAWEANPFVWVVSFKRVTP